jgi:ribonucleoside-diphosphate reductase alpha chain
MKLSENAKYILEQRYLRKNENREIVETPKQLFARVAKTIADIELKYGKSVEQVKKLEKEFYNAMVSFRFLPNSPTLMNAGTNLGQLSACFVLPIDDDIDSIFGAVHSTAKIHKSGGGTGFSFSRLRQREDVVSSTGGVASGPISFMTVFDCATDVIKQGGKRRGANMGVLRVDHPDIFDFVVLKEKEGKLRNFNLSVGLTEKFMQAVEKDQNFDLISPRTKKVLKSIKARALWILITTMSWKNGEPGVIFLDKINATNPTPTLGQIEATNPCGETPLLPYESCNLGSINLSKFVKDGKVEWEKLSKIVHLAVRFLDNVIGANKFPLKEIERATLLTRKIGLGVMGWADMLLELNIKYDTVEAEDLAKSVMKFISEQAILMSEKLGKEKGNFPAKDKSIYKAKEYMRNATLTTIAPTGTISIIANCSSGIEPIFAVVQRRHVKETLGKDLIEINPAIKRSLELKGLWNSTMEEALRNTECVKCSTLPDEMKKSIITSAEISAEWHVRMQAAFQTYTHNAVSKTINLPSEDTVNEIEQIYLLAYKLGCKGITVYRDGSRKNQLLTKDTEGRCQKCGEEE